MVALVAAYLLVIQSLMGAYSTGALAGPPKPDTAGFVICAFHAVESQPQEDATQEDAPRDPRQVFDYCKWACSVLPTALPAPDATVERAVAGIPATVVGFRHQTAVSSPDRKGTPGNPRAPPALA